MTSSSASSPCRLEWRPSRLLASALVSLGLLAAMAFWWSDLVRPAAALAGLFAVAEGVRLARRHLALPTLEVEWAGPGRPAVLNFPDRARVLDEVRVDFRGPLARLSGRDGSGRWQRWQWWPDTLPRSARRSLRLAASRAPSTDCTPPFHP